MSGMQLTTRSPSSSSSRRSTPCVLGCCGPMLSRTVSPVSARPETRCFSSSTVISRVVVAIGSADPRGERGPSDPLPLPLPLPGRGSPTQAPLQGEGRNLLESGGGSAPPALQTSFPLSPLPQLEPRRRPGGGGGGRGGGGGGGGGGGSKGVPDQTHVIRARTACACRSRRS